VSKRVSPTARLRADIDELFSSDRELSSILEDVARLSVRLMMQVAVEAEVDEFLGRVRYERRDDDDRPGSRNGWQPPATVKTTIGPVELQRPKLRGTDEAFCSRLFGAGVTRTTALESLVISGCVRGLSERDIEAALAEVLGPEAALSDAEPGDAAIAVATRQAAEFAAKWKTRYPAAVACVTDDLASLTVHLRFPAEHWKRIRHSNFIERTFGETRRRVKVIGRLPGESSCLSLVWAVLGRASRGWRGLTMTPKALRLLQDLRRQLVHPPITPEVITEAVTAAA
jgi:transposase-like protein